MSRRLPWPMFLMLWNGFNEIMVKKLPTGFRYASYEVTIPRKLMHKYWDPEPEFLTYLLQIEGKGQILHLRQKRGLVPRHFPVFTYSKQGHIQTDFPFVGDNCYYHGFVEDCPSSQAALSTCSGGLWGVLQVENKTFEIEPVQGSLTFQHVVYHLEQNDDVVRMRCGLTEEEQSHQEAMARSIESKAPEDRQLEWWPHTRYADIVIVVEHQRYVMFGRNENSTLLQILNILHISNLLFQSLGVHLSIVGIEIWSKKNLIEIADNINDTLKLFSDWRKDSLLKRIENDAAHLFVYKYFEVTIGLAYFGTICSTEKSAGVESFRTFSLFLISNTFVHQFGHNLGIRHDGKYCYCDRTRCIMTETHLYSDRFSNCSYSDYFNVRNMGCLFIPADPEKVHAFKYCGNSVLDEGEQCDCGSPAQCAFDPCCNSNCTFHKDAICSFGECCHDCHYASAGTVCRDEAGTCDLPEYCNGTSEWCPKNVYIQDGAQCSDNAFCYRGKCTTHEMQCRSIFGDRAVAASESCFRLLNVQGDRFGNCGLRHGVYKKCTPEDILCGRLHCENIEELPILQEHSTIIQTKFGGRECWSVDYHSGMEILDIGVVNDGTPCNTDMMCIDGKCLNVSHLKYDCDPKKCNNRGVCNTYGNCHCDYGWAPPYCKSEGFGGSINSGPAPRYLLGIVLGILCINSFSAVVIGLGVLNRKKLKRYWKRLWGQSTEMGAKQEEILQ